MISPLLLVLLLAALVPALSWQTCFDGAICPENPEGIKIGGRDADSCLPCGEVFIGNSTVTLDIYDPEQWSTVVEWLNISAIEGPPEECNTFGSGCICRAVGENCWSDYGVEVDIWMALSCLYHLYLWGLCVMYYKDGLKKKKKGAGVSSMEKILLLVGVACFMRFVWYIVIVNGRNASIVIGGQVFEAIMLKLPQLLWMGAFFYMASTWKKLYDQALTMKKANPKDQEKLDRLCNRVNGGIIGVIIPMGGVIKRCIIEATLAASSMLIGLGLNLMGISQKSTGLTFIFWMLIHLPECLAAHALLLTKISQKSNTIKKDKSDTTSATTASVAPEN
ncbi:hypothetical protein TeGR_g8811 [Tetraparma gracilis]|uniref:Uncharacterized protein n=1 Tax=Tetraparma gracilis TaxID=2962635 RepID=A0ABQ6MK99_9STRA|nr:hypothetical protein TeGR_g8811 [Tetraparma gracilis]